MLPSVHTNPQIMQCSTCSKYVLNKVIRPKSAFIFDNAHELGTSDGVLYPNPYSGNTPVVLFFFCREFLSPAFLDRLYDFHSFRGISLIACILVQGAWNREGIHRVRHLLVVHLSGNGPADEDYQARNSNNDGILDRVTFLLAAITLFLHLPVHRTWNLPFRPVVEQDRLHASLGEFLQPRGKFLVSPGGNKPHCCKTHTENARQAMDECVAMSLTHPETGGMIFLQGIILQIDQDEEQTVLHCGERTVLVDGGGATEPTTTFAGQLILREIIIMGCLEMGQKGKILLMAQTCQGTETFTVVFMFEVIHTAKVRVCAIYNKSNLHKL